MKPIEIIELRTCTIRIDGEGILRVKIKDGVKIDEEEVKKVYDVIRRLSRDKKMLELIEGGSFYTFNEDAQKYAAKHGKDLFIASAIIIRSTAMRLLFNFFNTFLKHPVPFKMFAKETDALQWLRSFKEN
ncbi:MAG: STAS/SEC14 domain-containing protein [Bacteroidia bacterium]